MAADTAALAEPVGRFNHMLLIALGALAAGLTAAAVVQVLVGLRPLARLRAQLASQHGGGITPIEGRFPSEIQPLVEDFNRVLAVNADMVQRARAGWQPGARGQDALEHPGQCRRARGQRWRRWCASRPRWRSARSITIWPARGRGGGRARSGRTPLRPPLEALLRVMRRLHAQRGLDVDMPAFPADLAFRGDEQDLQEMAGNLLDNACKWAARRLCVTARATAKACC